jgi:hypothetical protein
MVLLLLLLVAAALFGIGGVIKGLFWVALIGVVLFFVAMVRALGVLSDPG